MTWWLSCCAPCKKKKRNHPHHPSFVLGEGAYATVHGPLSSTDLQHYVDRWTSTTLSPEMPSTSLYVAKVYRDVKTMPLRPGETRVYETVAALQQGLSTQRILAPLLIDRTHHGYRLEIQEYGGREFTAVVHDRSWEWTDDMVWTLWVSFLEILRVGMDLIDHQLFLTDIKPENMVYTPEHGLALIDVEYVSLEDVYRRETQHVVFTPHPANVPPVFFRMFPESSGSFRTDHNDDDKNPTMPPWTRPFVYQLAVFCLFYPFAVLWLCLFSTMARSSRVMTRMTRLMKDVLQQDTDMQPRVLLAMMERVRLVDFPTLWEEYTAGTLKTAEDVAAVWISDNEIPFPRAKIEKVHYDDHYFF